MPRTARAEGVVERAEDAYLADLSARERATLLALLRRLVP